MNGDDQIDGILVQLPLPSHIDEQKIIMAIDPAKDVDGFHPVSVGKMLLEQDTFLPCTPHGILKLLEYSDISTRGKKVVVVGRSNIVGKTHQQPAHSEAELGERHRNRLSYGHGKDLKKECLEADILIAAAGRPEVITADMIRDGLWLLMWV